MATDPWPTTETVPVTRLGPVLSRAITAPVMVAEVGLDTGVLVVLGAGLEALLVFELAVLGAAAPGVADFEDAVFEVPRFPAVVGAVVPGGAVATGAVVGGELEAGVGDVAGAAGTVATAQYQLDETAEVGARAVAPRNARERPGEAGPPFPKASPTPPKMTKIPIRAMSKARRRPLII